MATQLRTRCQLAVLRAGAGAVALMLVLVVPERVRASPVLAQPYRVACIARSTPTVRRAGSLVAGNLSTITVDKFDATDVSFTGGEFGGAGAPGLKALDLMPGAHSGDPEIAIRCEHEPAAYSVLEYRSPAAAFDPQRPVGSTVSSWVIGSKHQPDGNDRETVHFKYYQTNQGIGENYATSLVPRTGPQTNGGPGFSYALNPQTRFFTTVYLAQNQRPGLRVLMRFTPPLWSPLK